MIKYKSIVVIFVLFIFAGVKATAQISAAPTVPEEAIQFNQALLNDMLKRDAEAVLEKSLDEVKAIDDLEASLNKFMSYLPDYEDGKTYDVLSQEVRKADNNEPPKYIYKTQYEITGLKLPETIKEEWALVDIYSQETDDGLKFRHFSFNTVALQPSTAGQFELKNKSTIHYLFLALLIAMPIFIIFTIIAIIRNKHMNKKWLWGLFSAVGLWGVNFNWATAKLSTEFFTVTSGADGAASVQLSLISFKLLGASILKQSAYSPYIITVAFPIGAVLYWVLKHKDKTVPQAFE